MVCVKCPVYEEWQMLKDCVSCRHSNLHKENIDDYYCSYDDDYIEKLITFGAELTEDKLEEVLDKILERRENLHEHLKNRFD
ncbi:MAG: hypothetical protein ACOC1K_01170 [Nanoarchaeota archaeon]